MFFQVWDSEFVKGEWRYSDFTKDSVKKLSESIGLAVLECFLTLELREERSSEKWVNVMGRNSY